jgi:hypothetical protein
MTLCDNMVILNKEPSGRARKPNETVLRKYAQTYLIQELEARANVLL